MELYELLKKPLPQMPPEIIAALDQNKITKTTFERKDEILANSDLHAEAGYTKMEDGSYLVSMYCPMPGITADMIAWWFWWHAQENLRYQVWFPGEHISNSYRRKDQAYFAQLSVPPFRANSQYPVERIGGVKMPLRIDFVTPESFGFSRQAMQDAHIAAIVCGHVGAFNNLVKHTEMAHIFKQTDDGLFMISRFWLGKTMRNPLLRKIILTDAMARGMAEHCCIEYRNLWEVLPILYTEYKS